MLKIKKIYYIILICFITLSIATIPTLKNDNTLRTNFEIENITGIKTNKVYLLNKNNYLTGVDIFLDKGNIKETVERIFNYLKESNNKMDSSFYGYIPDDAKIEEIRIDEKSLYLNISKEIKKDRAKLKIIIPGLVHSILEMPEIEYISLEIDSEYLEDDHKLLTKDYPINVEYNFTDRNNINKVVIYYNDKINNEDYYVPVTKYLNDNREKVEIIVDELKSNIPANLISYINNKTELLNYTDENNALVLDFNKYIEDDKKETTYQSIAYSIFNNYDIESVIYKIDGKIEKIINNTTK